MFESSYVDPFNLDTTPDELINIATGAKAPDHISQSLLSAIDKGDHLARDFVNERLVIKEDLGKPEKSLYATMKRSNVKTMAEMSKSVTVKAKNIPIDREVMYMRLLAINSVKKIPLKRIMSFENSSVPLSLFTNDGRFQKCTKSDIA